MAFNIYQCRTKLYILRTQHFAAKLFDMSAKGNRVLSRELLC